MRKSVLKMTAIWLAVLLLFALPVSVSATETSVGSVGASSGTTGDCVWTLDDEGKLTISGNGSMELFYYEGYPAPWGTGITSVTIENGVTSISYFAFYGCSDLTSVTIPDSVTEINNDAFSGCSSLTSITIPGSVTSIGHGVFDDCSSLTEIHIGDIASWCEAFHGGEISQPHGGTAEYYFYVNDVPLTDLVIPDGVSCINDWAFSNYQPLTSVTIPDSVRSIGEFAFEYCIGLTSVNIPDSVTSIGDNAFDNCGSVTIYGMMDSYAQSYAAEKNIPFRAVGDANHDGFVNINDVTAIQQHIAVFELLVGKQLTLADTNGDGAVDIEDATHLQYYLSEYEGIVIGKQN